VMELLGVVGKSVCSRAATTCVGVAGESIAFEEVIAAAPTYLQQLDTVIENTTVVGDMAMDVADPHKVCGADQEGFTITEAGAGTNMLGVIGMDGREEALVTPVKLVSVQAQVPSRRSSARRAGSLDEHSLARA